MKAHTIDHIVLAVSEGKTSRHWWSTVTGSVATTDQEGEVSLHVGGQAIRLRRGTPAPPGSVTMCLLTDSFIHEVYTWASAHNIKHGEAHPRTGAVAPLQAVTLEDPDGYSVELGTHRPEHHRAEITTP
jgi:catechol 2,3-dioxygenase-like lactoylglutathione lyase family enzyme